MIIKRLLLLPVIALLAWMVMAFVTVSQVNTEQKVEQLTANIGGEPDDLNPIISSTTSADDVEDLIYSNLLRYDEHLNIVGDVAESYVLSQDSTACFDSEAAAQAAESKLQVAKDKWPAMKLQSLKRDGAKLVLRFEDPKETAAGTSYEETLFSIIDKKTFKPAMALTITLDDASGAGTVQNKIKELASKIPGTSIHDIVLVGDSLLGVTAFGDVAKLKKQLESGLKDLKADIADSLEQVLLNEPVVTFKIRPGVRWHDGAPLTSADAAFTYRSILDPQYRSPRSSDYWPVKSVATPNDLTFVVRYRYPYCDCLLSWMMRLLPQHILEGKSAKWWADNFNTKHPIGTGPYKLAEWKRNEFLRLEANGDYFEGKPNIPAVVYRVIPDAFVNQVAFDAREFDFNGLSPFQVRRYEQDNDFQTFRRWGLAYDYIGWNLKNPLFQDVRVRQALAKAVNVERMVKYIYRGYARAANGPFPAHLWYANKDLKPFEYNLKEAEELLKQAGWKDKDAEGYLVKNGKRFEFNLITNNGASIRQTIQTLVQDDLKKVGIKVNTAQYEWAVFIKNYVDARQYDACVLGWSLGYSYDQFQIWHSSQMAEPGLNFVSYKSAKADDLLLKIRTTFDRKEVVRLCHELQETIYNDQPYLFLTFAENTYALYRDKYVVRRPNDKGGWTLEPVRSTEAGFTHYLKWWAPQRLAPQIAP